LFGEGGEVGEEVRGEVEGGGVPLCGGGGEGEGEFGGVDSVVLEEGRKVSARGGWETVDLTYYFLPGKGYAAKPG
jgi:hypothetical protein